MIVILGRNLPDGVHYHLPKGTLHHDETLENCAKREVLEESGYETEIIDLVASKTDSYVTNSMPIEKTTIYFAMQIINNTQQHDAEHDFVTEMKIEEAIKKLQATEPEKAEHLVLEKFQRYITQTQT